MNRFISQGVWIKVIFSLWILAHLLKMVMEPKYLTEEVIIHPLLIIWQGEPGSIGILRLQWGCHSTPNETYCFFHHGFVGKIASFKKWRFKTTGTEPCSTVKSFVRWFANVWSYITVVNSESGPSQTNERCEHLYNHNSVDNRYLAGS